jgi:hypothetical protein
MQQVVRESRSSHPVDRDPCGIGREDRSDVESGDGRQAFDGQGRWQGSTSIRDRISSRSPSRAMRRREGSRHARRGEGSNPSRRIRPTASARRAYRARTCTCHASSRPPRYYSPRGWRWSGRPVSPILGVSSEIERSRLERTCSPNCPDDDVIGSTVSRSFANISAGVGGAALATGMILLIVRPSVPAAPGGTALSVTPVSGGGQISATGSF